MIVAFQNLNVMGMFVKLTKNGALTVKGLSVLIINATLKKNDFVGKTKKQFRGKIYFDIEAFVNSKNFHEANLIMAKRVCKSCENSKILCELCNFRYEFENVEAFVSWVLSKANKNFIFISHNGTSYDHYFIMRYLQKSKLAKDSNLKALTNGQKVLSFNFRSRFFKDSSLFITKPLENFAKIFNLTENKKGFFPHLLNKPEKGLIKVFSLIF